MKFAEGDYVVHPGQGVCQVMGVDERTTIVGASADHPGHKEKRLEYDLLPMAGKCRIHYPVMKEDELRPVIDATSARDLIAEAPTLTSDTFDKQQSWTIRDHFMGCLRDGDCREAMRVVKTLHERMNASVSQGRKPKACYAHVFDEAKERLYNELSISLEMPQDEVESLVQKRFEEYKATCA